MFDGRRHDGCGPATTMGMKRMAALKHAPTEIVCAMHQVRGLPKVLPVVADPDVAGLAIDVHAPWIAEAVSPNLRPGTGQVHEWVIRRHGVGLSGRGMIDIDADQSRQQVADILAAVPCV